MNRSNGNWPNPHTSSGALSATTTTAIPLKDGHCSATDAGGNVKTRHGESVWLNSKTSLPPVNCLILIELPGALVPATRTGFIRNRCDAMEYRLTNGDRITGRYRWTYP